MRIAGPFIGAAGAAIEEAAKNAAAGDKGQPQAKHLPSTCEGFGRALNTKQRKCYFCGRPTRL